jgi:predicted transcriptional regulator
MVREALLLSIRPTFAERILAGTKTVELRRVKPSARVGQSVLIYGSAPTMALLGTATVDRVDVEDPKTLWPRVRASAGVTRAEYVDYFDGAQRAAAIWLRDVVRFAEPVGLATLRQRWPWFRAPQSYCFVRVGLVREGSSVRSLAPRNAA